jgi:hypothetical protein
MLHKFERQLIEDYLLMFPGQKFDPMTTIRGVRERWGIRIDWHEAGAVLNAMRRRDEVVFVGNTGPDNFPEYVVNMFKHKHVPQGE